MANPDEVAAGRPVVLRGGTVLTMDDAHTILADADVLVTGDRIAAVGPRLEAPDGALEIDASGGIVMPGMIDTHRHMWQTAMRAYGADWTLTQYFVWNYLEHGRKFRPEDIYAGNLVSAWESLEAGVTTTVDWSHNLHTPTMPKPPSTRCARGRRFVPLRNIRPAPGSGPPTRPSGRSRPAPPMTCSVPARLRRHRRPVLPGEAAFEAARELGLAVTTHAGVWGPPTTTASG
jgi:cytosine/adenosine deaminase-related metal-dependent hydrolase